MKINWKYMMIFIILFIIEIFIAIYIHDKIIRPYVGDILVVILLYTFLKGIISNNSRLLPIYIFIFAVFVEVLQYFNIVELLNLQNSKIALTIIGSSFDFKDILCYLIGTIIIFVLDRKELKVIGNKR